LADVVILAEDAAKVTHGKEYRPASAGSSQAIFFAEMGEITTDQGMTAGFADSRIVRQPVDAAVSRANVTIGQCGNGFFAPLPELAASMQGHVSGFEVTAGEYEVVDYIYRGHSFNVALANAGPDNRLLACQ
jgi:hypothetical protein